MIERVNRRAVSRTDQGKSMKADIHPEYQTVIFHDTSVDEYFMTRSTLKTSQTIEWKDGKTYPYCTIDTSSASHRFIPANKRYWTPVVVLIALISVSVIVRLEVVSSCSFSLISYSILCSWHSHSV